MKNRKIEISWGVPYPMVPRGDQVRALGRMPKENHDPKEGRLAHDLRKARDAGLMTSYEPELRELEIKEHAQQAQGLMQQVSPHVIMGWHGVGYLH